MHTFTSQTVQNSCPEPCKLKWPLTQKAKALKEARYALWKNPAHLGEHQQTILAWTAKPTPDCTEPIC